VYVWLMKGRSRAAL